MRSRRRALAAVAAATAALAALLAGPVPPGGASFPGQNGKIAFDRTPPGVTAVIPPDIWTMNPDGSGAAAFAAANSSSSDIDPAWSADGKKLAFSSNRPAPNQPPGSFEIYTIRSDGTGLTKITNDPATTSLPGPDDVEPAWSPDGNRLAWIRNNALVAANADGSGLVSLGVPGAVDGNPNWSPDGRRIAFDRSLRTSAGVPDIFAVDPNGANLVNLTNSPNVFETEPSWSPDGSRLAINWGADISIINADGSNLTEVTDDGVDIIDRSPAWSPDGTKIAFVQGISDSSQGYVYAVNVDGTGLVQLTKTTATDEHVDWQPLPPVVQGPGDLDFGDVILNQDSGTASTGLTNIGTGSLVVGTATLGGANAGDFVKLADNCSGKTVAPGAGCQVTFQFHPTALGARTATVTFTDNAKGSPRSATLRGRGVAPGTVVTTAPTTSTTAPPPPPGVATLVLQPAIGPPGFVTLAVGAGFPAGTTVNLKWQPGIGQTTAVTDAAGTFRVPVLIFHHDQLGPRQLVATRANGPAFSPDPLPAPFLVVAGSLQPGDFVLRR